MLIFFGLRNGGGGNNCLSSPGILLPLLVVGMMESSFGWMTATPIPRPLLTRGTVPPHRWSTRQRLSSSTSVEVETNLMRTNNAQDDSVYTKLGLISEEQLALGVNPEDVLTYLGSREDLIQRTMNDIPDFDRSKAEIEVDKFLLDQEALTLMIQFMKKKAENPEFAVPAEQAPEEGLFSFRTLFILYLIYFVYSTGTGYLKKWAIDQQAMGTWKGTGIPALDEWLNNEISTVTTATTSSIAVTSLEATGTMGADGSGGVLPGLLEGVSAALTVTMNAKLVTLIAMVTTDPLQTIAGVVSEVTSNLS